MPDKPHITAADFIAQLTRLGSWPNPQSPIAYAYLNNLPPYMQPGPNYLPLSAAQRAAVERAFALIAEVTNLTFFQVTDNQLEPSPTNQRITFLANSVNLNFSGSTSYYVFDDTTDFYGADITLNNARIAQRAANEGWTDFNFDVTLHEILHALGLSHPGDYNGQGFTYANDAEFVEDTKQYSVMSYWAAGETGADHFVGSSQISPSTPLLFDIAALHFLYGANMSTRTGDTIYGFNSNTGSGPFNFVNNTRPVLAIWDAGGIDTIDLSGFADPSLINLNAGEFSDAATMTKNISIAFGAVIENAIGGPGNDQLIGNAVANQLRGGGGDDSLTGNGGDDDLEGGAGTDMLTGGTGNDLYRISATDSADLIVENAGEGSDTVLAALNFALGTNLENLTLLGAAANGTGNAFANILTGNDLDNRLQGGGGNDSLYGAGGSADVAIYAGNRADYRIDTNGQVTVTDLNLTDGDDGIDLLFAIEFIQFANVTLQVGVDTNNAPQLGQPALIDQLWGDGVSTVYFVPQSSFTDSDAQDVLSYSASLASGAALPLWLSFDSSTRRFSGAPPVDQIGAVLEVRVTASDGLASVSDNFVISVTQSPGAPISGTEAPDVLDGTFRVETISGLGGNDVIRSSAGADRIDGGAGQDEVDYSASTAGIDINLGNGAGLGGHAQGDELIAIERVIGSAFNDHLVGAAFDEMFSGGGGSDLLEGGGGLDRLDGGAGADNMIGGLGDDLYFVDDPNDSVVEAAGGGTDLVHSSISHVLAAEFERLTLTGSANIDGMGNSLANIIVGNGGANLLDGGPGADQLQGSLGNDIYVIDNVGDVVGEFAGEGDDIIRSSISLTLVDHVETLQLIGASDVNATGNALANVIVGNGGHNVLAGGGGGDVMTGGFGDDVYIVDALDSLNELPGGGIDTVQTDFSFTLSAELENLTLTGSGAIDGTGNDNDNRLAGNGANNRLSGGAGHDRLDGGGGADTLTGGTGDDAYVVDEAGDLIVELAGEGMDLVESFISYGLDAELENLTLVGTAVIDAIGNALNNVLTGNGAANVLDGGAGADAMYGGLGDDRYLIDSLDSISELAGEGTDTVEAGYSFVLPVHFENLVLSGSGDISGEGNGANNLIIGNSGNNVLYGAGGADLMFGGLGNDVLEGGSGVDDMTGGAGDDIYFVDDAGDDVNELAGGGTDTVVTAVGSKALPDRAVYVLPGFVENLIGTSAGNQGVRDNGSDNVITLGGGHDLIVADAGGTDTLNGGSGNDFIYFGDKWTAADVANGGGGTDTVGLLGSYSIAFTAANLVGVERLALYSGAALPGAGPSSYIITFDDANVAAGGEFFVTAASLQAYEGLVLNASAETEGRFTILGGAGGDAIYGGQSSDFLNGNAGNDYISGQNGTDFIIGGLGADQLSGGAKADFFRYSSTAQSQTGSVDHILDFEHVDRIDLSAIDANGNAGDGNQAFSFIGGDAFHNVAGELRAYQSGDDWFVEGDVNGDGTADLIIQVTVTDATPLLVGDFIL